MLASLVVMNFSRACQSNLDCIVLHVSCPDLLNFCLIALGVGIGGAGWGMISAYGILHGCSFIGLKEGRGVEAKHAVLNNSSRSSHVQNSFALFYGSPP